MRVPEIALSSPVDFREAGQEINRKRLRKDQGHQGAWK